MATIVIDPGHGGQKSVGGSSPNNATGPKGTLEKTLTLEIGLGLAKALGGTPHKVVLTRTDDHNLALSERAAVAKKHKADLFLCIHFNGFSNPQVNGIETLLHPRHASKSRRFADIVQKGLLAAIGLRDRGVKTQVLGALNPAYHAGNTAACLVEISFLTHPQEEQRLADPGYKSKIVQALARAMVVFLATEEEEAVAQAAPEILEAVAAAPAPFRLADMRTLEELAEDEEQEESLRRDSVSPLASLTGRNGYHADFLSGFAVPLPKPGPRWTKDLAPVRDGGNELKYRNFSVVMSKARRLALVTACNIDGAHSQSIERGRDLWRIDSRIDAKHQVGEFLYANNALDRGHLVRREDPVWGPQAGQANTDTFHFTNCSPQHMDMNQKTWLGLEDYILRNARVEKMRVTVFTGPVLAADDPVYRGVMIPKKYWKVVAFRGEERPSATAYLLSQADLIDTLEFVYGPYKTYQVSVRHVEELTGLHFGVLHEYDGFSGEESVTLERQQAEITHWGAIRV